MYEQRHKQGSDFLAVTGPAVPSLRGIDGSFCPATGSTAVQGIGLVGP